MPLCLRRQVPFVFEERAAPRSHAAQRGTGGIHSGVDPRKLRQSAMHHTLAAHRECTATRALGSAAGLEFAFSLLCTVCYRKKAGCVIRLVDTAVQAVNCATRFGRNQRRNWVRVHGQGVDMANTLMQPGETSRSPIVKVVFPTVIGSTRSGQHQVVRPTTAAFLTDVIPLHAASDACSVIFFHLL